MSSQSSSSTATAALPYGIAPSGFRLPADTHIGVVRLQVADLARSLAYYQQVLGFRPLDQSSGVATLAAMDGQTPIIELREKPGVRSVPKRGLLGLYHFAILLPDRASLGRLISHLSNIGIRMGMADHLVSEAIYLTDPDGLGIEVYTDRPRETWRHEGRQLLMASDPLNIPDLVAAGGGAPWRGMPNGTTMGHVHLYVGDLDEGAAFYHQALGFDKITWGYPGALFLSAGGYHHHLGTNTWAQGAPVATDDDARLIEWELVLPDAPSIAAAAGSIEQSGRSVERLPDASVRARDPWGTAVRLVTS